MLMKKMTKYIELSGVASGGLRGPSEPDQQTINRTIEKSSHLRNTIN
jgi:hypothetical protein